MFACWPTSHQANAHILLIFYIYVYKYVYVYVRCLQDVCVDVYVLSGRLHVAFLQTVIYMLLKPEHRHGKYMLSSFSPKSVNIC